MTDLTDALLAEINSRPRSRTSRSKRMGAYREVKQLRKRIAYRCGRLAGWRFRWSWDQLRDLVEKIDYDRARVLEIVETWWPDQVDAYVIDVNRWPPVVNYHVARVAYEHWQEYAVNPLAGTREQPERPSGDAPPLPT